MARIRLLTYNIAHARGLSLHQSLRSRARIRAQLVNIAHLIRRLDADIVAFQEIDENSRWSGSFDHLAFLAEHTGLTHFVHGVNNRLTHFGGHLHLNYGNAILSRFPILASHNQDVTHLRFERRGMLHCVIEAPGLAKPLHCVCVHLSLFGRSRRHQIDALASRLESIVPADSPMLIAGDFNDWRNRAHDLLAERMGLTEVFSGRVARPPKSFPSALPLLRLDRIYARGFTIERTEVHCGMPWSRISDHAALSAHLLPLLPFVPPARR